MINNVVNVSVAIVAASKTQMDKNVYETDVKIKSNRQIKDVFPIKRYLLLLQSEKNPRKIDDPVKYVL